MALLYCALISIYTMHREASEEACLSGWNVDTAMRAAVDLSTVKRESIVLA
jgi:hypothetical protein